MKYEFIISTEKVEYLKEAFPDADYKYYDKAPGFTVVKLELTEGVDVLQLFNAGMLAGVKAMRPATH